MSFTALLWLATMAACIGCGDEPTPVPPPPAWTAPVADAIAVAAIDAPAVDAAASPGRMLDPEARALLEKALVAHGSPTRIRGVTSIVRRGTVRVHDTAIHARRVDWTRFPDRTRIEDDTWPAIVGFDGTRAWSKLADSPAKDASGIAAELREAVWGDEVRLVAQLLDSEAVSIEAAPTERLLDGKPVYELAYRHGDETATLRFDRVTLRLVQRSMHVGPRPDGHELDFTITYRDYRRVDGIWIAHLHERLEELPGRKVRYDHRWTRIELDRPLADEMFVMPAAGPSRHQ